MLTLVIIAHIIAALARKPVSCARCGKGLGESPWDACTACVEGK